MARTPTSATGSERRWDAAPGGGTRRGASVAAGFTLLELVLAMLILGLAVAVTYPALSRGSASLELRAAGRDVLNVFRFAREKAISEGGGALVVVEPDSGTIRLTDAYGEGERSMRLRSGIAVAALAVNGAEIAGGPLVVRFLPNGSSEAAAVVLRARSGAVVRVVTDPITGGARIETPGDAERRGR